MLVMTIESSCDETSAAVVQDGRRVLSNAVASQVPVHQKYGGVVPEIASRNHIRDIQPIVDRALEEASVELGEIDGFGVTAGPGLIGSLLVGIETAKGLAYAYDRPCVGLNHIEGHLTTALLETEQGETPEFPYIGLVASGGHSDLFVVEGFGDYERMGGTRDDAAGEAFDKVAKMLGLPYPGGVHIDRLADQGDPEAIDFPRPMWTRQNFDFSFAGLKTAVYRHLKEHGEPDEEQRADICASFQQAAVDVLVMKTIEAASRRHIGRIVLSGGVAANSQLRAQMRREADQQGLEVFVAPAELCTDNAAMLGPIAEHYLGREGGQTFAGHGIRAESNVELGR
jgi:N6-L-threonylcarbamoyladenine synthase